MNSYFGKYGGSFASEILMPALDELETLYIQFSKDKSFSKELNSLLKKYAGRPTPLYFASNLSLKWKGKIYLKREDLLHTGAHKINNSLAQVLLAKKMGKKRIIAETGAGQHGVATATACSLFKIPCTIYMGTEDLRRQALNKFRMELLGAQVIASGGSKGTLRHAINDALRDWATNVDNTHYVIGSVVGPHPFPTMVRNFQSVIGREARSQILKLEGNLPKAIFACVGGGSNAIGFFHHFRNDKVKLIGVEAGGENSKLGNHSSTLTKGTPGVLHGSFSYLLQDKEGQIADVHSISAGLDYPSVGPEHAYLKDSGRAEYYSVTDKQALATFQEVSKEEGIIPALETAHAFAFAKKWLKQQSQKEPLIIINLSGRGDKDVQEALHLIHEKKHDIP